jgi:hypothetical protein
VLKKNHGEEISRQEQIAGELRNFMDRNNNTTLLSIKENTLELCKSKNELERQAADNKAALKYKSLKNKCELERQASDNFAAIQLKILENRMALEKQASDNHVTSQLTVAKYKEEIAKQLAECCCELKQLVTAQHCEIKKVNIKKFK